MRLRVRRLADSVGVSVTFIFMLYTEQDACQLFVLDDWHGACGPPRAHCQEKNVQEGTDKKTPARFLFGRWPLNYLFRYLSVSFSVDIRKLDAFKSSGSLL